MTNWYATREAVKLAGAIKGAARNPFMDELIEAASRQIDNETHTFFIPKTETRLYRWPPSLPYRTTVLELDQYLRSVSTLQAQAQDSSPTTIASTDYFLEPANAGFYDHIEIDLSSTAAFQSGDTPQRSISVAGIWGRSGDTRSVGTVTSGLASDATATTFITTRPDLIGIGATLLIESEQVFVTARAFAAIGTELLDGALTATQSQVGVTVDDASSFIDGEVIRVDSELMLVESRNETTEVLTVVRAYDGSTLAAHSNDTAVHGSRTLTITRGVNGTTAATHANATAVSEYQAPADVRRMVRGIALATAAQEQSDWGRQVGAGEAAQEFSGKNLAELIKTTLPHYYRTRVGAI